MAKLKFVIPDADAPGFLRRQRKLMEFINCLDDSPEKWSRLVDLLLLYVESPKDSKAAEEAIWELSQNEYEKVLKQISNQGEVDPNT